MLQMVIYELMSLDRCSKHYFMKCLLFRWYDVIGIIILRILKLVASCKSIDTNVFYAVRNGDISKKEQIICNSFGSYMNIDKNAAASNKGCGGFLYGLFSFFRN